MGETLGESGERGRETKKASISKQKVWLIKPTTTEPPPPPLTLSRYPRDDDDDDDDATVAGNHCRH